MTNSQKASYSQSLTNFQPEHIKEFQDSAIDDVTAAHNFRSFEPSTNPNDTGSEYELDEIFCILIDEPIHLNNGGLSGKSQQELVNTLHGGVWVFEGHKGKNVKPDEPRKGKQKKVISDEFKLEVEQKYIKYESVRGKGNQQVFIPHVSVRVATLIDKNIRYFVSEDKRVPNYVSPEGLELDDIDPNFWSWYLATPYPLGITEAAKKVCSIVSNGFPAIGLNGVAGWSNGKDDNGNRLVHQELLPFLNGREIILAFDIDKTAKTVKKVKAEKLSFYNCIKNKSSVITEIKWDSSYKGVDDWLGSIADENRREVDLSRAFLDRSEVIKPESEPKNNEDSKPPRFASSIDTGLVESKKTLDGEILVRIGNHLEATAWIDNPDQDGAALRLEFKTCKGFIRNWTMPRACLGGDSAEIVSELSRRGYSFHYEQKKSLLTYLYSLGSKIEQEYTVTDSSGWVKESFVLPHKTYGDPDLRFRDVDPSPDVITEIKGTLQGWRDGVAARCAGNSRLILGIGCSFAAPLLPIADVESGGFHLVGITSQGKTTILSVAASVTGLKTVSSWRTTDNALEGGLEASNHLCLPLDELNQADPRKVGSIVYMLGNGIGKGRSTKNLTNRKSKKWLTLVLSSGETTIGKYMDSAGEAIKGGQEVRLPDVPAVPEGSQYGCFETIHGANTAVQFVSALESAAKESHGTALDAFLSRLVVEAADPTFASTLSKKVHLIAAKLCEGTKDSAIGRVAKRFALVQVSLGLAHKYDLLPFPVEQIDWAISECFNAWVKERGGDGSIEIKNAVKGIRLLLTLEKHGNRVMDVKTHNVRGNQKIEKPMGKLLAYRKIDGDGNAEEFWIEPPIFDSELCKGVNKDALTKELHRMGWLIPRSDSKMTNQRSADGERNYYYVLSGKHVLGGE